MLTVYGRNAVMETLQDNSLSCHALHLADSNRDAKIITNMINAANARGIEVQRHSRDALARISKNGKQDQGVALDVLCPSFNTVEQFLDDGLPTSGAGKIKRILALDGISNPQNLGMIIRSAAAGAIDGIVLARKGNAALGPLVIKASAGTVYKAPLLLCDTLPGALNLLQAQGAAIYYLAANGSKSLFEAHTKNHTAVYVLGNETQGVSKEVREIADTALQIPMRNGVESLNVAVSASLIAYADYLER